eukprot:GILI01031615.1.p1 GENE.GILI01031615.1~~GILI01031615.1.p1  ORF type:complete len:453 (-),score=-2.58 GILI01031615.1:22-1233(-)
MNNAPSILSNDPTVSEQLRLWGPDLFRIRIAGPEVVVGLAQLVEECTYNFTFSLNVRGSYNVALERLYAKYDAINEAFSAWPHLLKEPVLEVDAPTSNYHTQQRTLESSTSLQCTDPTPRRPPTTLCTGKEGSTKGRWLVEHPRKTVYTRVRVRKIQRNPIKFKWALQGDNLSHWSPDTCKVMTTSDYTAVEPRLAGKRIVVAGDSQLRALYFGLVNTLAGNGNQCVLNISSEEAEPPVCVANTKGNHKRQFGDIQVDFYDDLFLDKFASSSKFDGYDVMIVGFAQHPASKEHWPLKRYFASVDQKARKIKNLQSKVVWYLAPQYPHTTNGYPVAVKDWRTDARLTLFNGYAEKVMREIGVPIVDGYSISTGMSHTSPDQAHYSNFVSHEIVQLLLSVLYHLK